MAGITDLNEGDVSARNVTRVPPPFRQLKKSSMSMTIEAQRIAIAEACGYTKPEHQPFKETQWFSSDGLSTFFSQLPDYLTDLNAMHDAEKVLGNRLRDYPTFLAAVCGMERWATNPSNINAMIAATAAQRAEAFLRTLGKWEDGK